MWLLSSFVMHIWWWHLRYVRRISPSLINSYGWTMLSNYLTCSLLVTHFLLGQSRSFNVERERTELLGRKKLRCACGILSFGLTLAYLACQFGVTLYRLRLSYFYMIEHWRSAQYVIVPTENWRAIILAKLHYRLASQSYYAPLL